MAETKSKRLVDLLTLLLNSRYPVARESIRRLSGYPRGEEAFHRQFERDKQTLRDLGFPLHDVDEDNGGGYVLERARIKLPEIRLTPDEIVALALARRLVAFHALVGGTVRDAIGKLGLAPADTTSAPEVVIAAPRPRSKTEEERLRLIESALARNHRLRISYRSLGQDSAVAREFDPYGLFVYGGAWYTVGRDHLRGEVRTFRVSRIAKVARTGRGASPEFEPPVGFRVDQGLALRPWRAGVGETRDVIVRFASAERWRVPALRGPGVDLRPAPDDALEVRFRGANPDAFVPWVMGFGQGVEILSPPELREEARKLARRVADAHRGEPRDARLARPRRGARAEQRSERAARASASRP